METNLDAEETTPPANPESTPPPAAEAAPEPEFAAPADAAPEAPVDTEAVLPIVSDDPAGTGDELAQLAEAAVKARLAPEDEERLTSLLKAAVLGGRAGVARAIEMLPRVPWIVGVRAVEQAWPELTAGFRTQLFAGLAKEDSDAARRIRLSLARAIFKIDVPTALKIALGVLKDLREKETGELTARNAQIISNVFIGRGKPWLTQFPLAELKPAEIDLLVHCATLAAFTVPHPPVTQLGVLKWALDAGRLEQLEGPALGAVLKGVTRWSAKWQGALRKEVAPLPETIASVLKPAAAEALAAEAGEPAVENVETADEESETEDAEGDEPVAEDEEAPRKERPVYEPRPQRPREAAEARERDAGRERPVYTPRNAGAGGGRPFELKEALRAIETHVQSLRQELATAQTKLRQKDDDRRPRRAEKSGPIIVGEPTSEELARLNLQLESRNQELQARIEELTQHSEDMAASSGAISGEPVTDTGAQLRALLALKLQEDYADFAALEKDSHDLVVSQHYPTILRHIFEVLREAEVPLQESAPTPG